MSELKTRAEAFRALHVAGRPLVLFNVWDAGSAKAVAAAGASAIATGSWSVAAANGFTDGEQIPLDMALENLRRIVAATVLPVTVDLESGYGKSAVEVGRTIGRAIEAGAVGCNLEDSFPESGKLRESTEQTLRIREVRRVAQAAGIPYFINARTDVFFQKPPAQHDESMLREAIERGRAYADAGADGLFAPGLMDRELIARLAAASSLPLNILVEEASPGIDVLTAAGVARVSHGPGPYLEAMKLLEERARAVMGRIGQ
ncbi:MAG: isocitrate lyase/phosphoenolpyruvate mutase family protein [Steroidobacterales bacterium]|jgi:methylisocitrate lyase